MKYDLKLERIATGCIIPTSHRLNQDGYFRKYIDGKQVMYHRYVWEQKKGSIPEGYEINHRCKNRACCNIDHLQLLDPTTHRSQDNGERYNDIIVRAWLTWQDSPEILGKDLASLFNRAEGQGCRWLRAFRKGYDPTNLNHILKDFL